MAEVWEGWFTVGIVFVAFGCLLWDVIQPDHVMIGAVAVLMAAGVVSVEEGPHVVTSNLATGVGAQIAARVALL